MIGAIARATHRANMQQTAGGRSQAIGSLNVCGCKGMPVSDLLLLLLDPCAARRCSIAAHMVSFAPLCRPLSRHAPAAAIDLMRRAYCKHSLGSTATGTASAESCAWDESASQVSPAALDYCFAIGMRGRSVCACVLMRCSRARPGLVESTHGSNQTSVSGPGATSGACAAEVQLEDAMGDG